MNRITVEQLTGLHESPKPLVVAYTRTQQMTTLHTHIEEYEATDEELAAEDPPVVPEEGETVNRTRYRCDLISIITDGRYKEMTYEVLVGLLVEVKYSKDAELAAHRKAIEGDTTAFKELCTYVEDCKVEARKIFPEEGE